MKRISIAIVLLFVFAFAASAAQEGFRVAVMDFSVQSDNPQYKYFGKGFTELTAVELFKIPGVVLIDREHRNEILKEQEFALSGMADESKAIQVGKLLAAEYLVTGEIIDMMGELIVSVQVFKTDTGQIVLKDKAEGAPAEYKRMIKELSASISRAFTQGPMVAQATASPSPVAQASPSAKPEEQATVLAKFSEAIQAIDEGKNEKAKGLLEEAQKIDPNDEAVKYYLDKLSVGTSKFAVIPQTYFSMDNPAGLGFLKTWDFYYFISAAFINFDIVHGGFYALSGLYGLHANGSTIAESYDICEGGGRIFVGLKLPVADNLGIGIQGFASMDGDAVNNISNPNKFGTAVQSMRFLGGELLLGYAPLPWLSIGFGATLGYHFGYVYDSYNIQPDNAPYNDNSFFFAGEIGLIMRSLDGAFVFTLDLGTSSYLPRQMDMDRITLNEQLDILPYFVDTSITFGLSGMNDFIVLKYMMSGFIAQSQTAFVPAAFGQLLPAYEHWFDKSFSLRLGGVLSVGFAATPYIGYGAIIGITYISPGGSPEYDLSLSYIERPAAILHSQLVPVGSFSFGMHWRG